MNSACQHVAGFNKYKFVVISTFHFTPIEGNDGVASCVVSSNLSSNYEPLKLMNTLMNTLPFYANEGSNAKISPTVFMIIYNQQDSSNMSLVPPPTKPSRPFPFSLIYAQLIAKIVPQPDNQDSKETIL